MKKFKERAEKRKITPISNVNKGRKRKFEEKNRSNKIWKYKYRKEKDLTNLPNIIAAAEGYQSKEKKKYALLHANRYLLSLSEKEKKEFPFRRVEDMTFKDIDSNVGDIVGKFFIFVLIIPIY